MREEEGLEEEEEEEEDDDDDEVEDDEVESVCAGALLCEMSWRQRRPPALLLRSHEWWKGLHARPSLCNDHEG